MKTSNVGRGWFSQSTAWFALLMPTHMCMSLVSLGTTASGLTQFEDPYIIYLLCLVEAYYQFCHQPYFLGQLEFFCMASVWLLYGYDYWFYVLKNWNIDKEVFYLGKFLNVRHLVYIHQNFKNAEFLSSVSTD